MAWWMGTLLAAGTALAGYGDASNGLPTHAEREVHFWTNAVRVDPGAFADDYPCSFGSFSSTESSPKWPLYWNEGLGAAANYHSTDMNVDGYFDHDSNDGTSWSTRIYSFYSGSTIGENIAWGYSSPYSAVVEGWMCSGGHRANIMSTSFDELGTGVSGTYYTQDFGSGSPPARAITMGIHLPASPSGTVQFGADWAFDTGPDALFVVLDGERHDMSLYVGDATGYSAWATEAAIGGGCHEYYFVGQSQGLEQTFPETGSYGFGSCDFDDAGAGWLAGQIPWEVDEVTTPDPTGDPDPTDDDDPEDDDTEGDDDDDDDAEGDDDTEDDDSLNGDLREEHAAGGCQVATGLPGVSGLFLTVFALYRRRR